MGRLLLVRHGESIWNRDAIVQGQDGPGLSRLGHEQASHLARWLVDEIPPDVAFVSSDLVRCLETAAPLAAALGRQPDTDATLRERHFGDWQGLARDSIVAHDTDRWSRFTHREDVVAEVGGESTPTLLARVLPTLRRLASASSSTIVVTHGGPIWHGVHALLDIPEPVLGPVGNTAVTTIDLDPSPRRAGDGVRLIGWNAVGHLPPDERTTFRRPRPPVRGSVTASADGIT